MERVYTMVTTILTAPGNSPCLLDKEELNTENFYHAVDCMRKFETDLTWKESTRNGLPCFTCNTNDGILKVFFE